MKRGILLLATVGAAFLLASGLALISTVSLGQPSVAQAQTSTTKDAQPEAATGVFNVRWGDPPPGSGDEAKIDYALVDDQGKATKLVLDRGDTESKGGPLALKGKRVKVEGTRKSDKRLDVEKIDFERPEDAQKARAGGEAGEQLAAQNIVSGSKPWVTIGCRFKDSSGPPPKPKSYYEGLIGAVAANQDPAGPGMDDYWRELSFDKINLAGSQVGRQNSDVFWYKLPRNRSYYVPNPDSPRLDQIAKDCTAAANADVTFTKFHGINMVFDRDIGCCSWGGDVTLTHDLPRGQSKTYAAAWLPVKLSAGTDSSGHDWMAHEMGHGFGLTHSSGPYGATYDSEWDVMSGAGVCQTLHQDYDCISDHTISYHKDLLGWIPSGPSGQERKYVAAPGSDRPITIERLGLPNDNEDYLIAQIPTNDPTKFYTVEARRFQGYDGHVNGRIPDEAIVIHRVDTVLGDRNAQIVDPDDNGNPNDAGAMWLPDPGNDPSKGEIFEDTTNGIKVQVTEKTASGYKVQITVS